VYCRLTRTVLNLDEKEIKKHTEGRRYQNLLSRRKKFRKAPAEGEAKDAASADGELPAR
jgi:hypothetical protein